MLPRFQIAPVEWPISEVSVAYRFLKKPFSGTVDYSLTPCCAAKPHRRRKFGCCPWAGAAGRSDTKRCRRGYRSGRVRYTEGRAVSAGARAHLLPVSPKLTFGMAAVERAQLGIALEAAAPRVGCFRTTDQKSGGAADHEHDKTATERRFLKRTPARADAQKWQANDHVTPPGAPTPLMCRQCRIAFPPRAIPKIFVSSQIFLSNSKVEPYLGKPRKLLEASFFSPEGLNVRPATSCGRGQWLELAPTRFKLWLGRNASLGGPLWQA
jgi:hypothetical protein